MKLGDGLMASKSERQRTSGPQKRSKSDFIYCPQHVLALSRKLAKTVGEKVSMSFELGWTQSDYVVDACFTYICSCSDIGWVLVVRILVHGYRPLSKPMSLWPGGRVYKSSIEKGVLGQIEFNHLL